MPRRNTPPRNNSTFAYRFNPATASEVPSIDAILQSLRKSNAGIQIQKRGDLGGKKFASSATPTNGFDHLEQSMQSIGKEMRSAKEKMQDILSSLRALNEKHDGASSPSMHHQSFRSASPRYEIHHREHVHHQEIPEASVLPVPLSKQLVKKLIEIVEPALIVQDPVDRREDVNKVSGQKLQETAAHQVFEEMPQPATQTFDDEDKGVKNQETEVSPDAAIDCAVEGVQMQEIQGFSLQATSKDFPEIASKFNHPVLENHEVHIHEIKEFGINLLNDDAKLELNLCVKKNVQDYTVIFPASNTEELSYVVVGNCNLEVNNILMDVLHLSQVIRRDGEEKEKIGVG